MRLNGCDQVSVDPSWCGCGGESALNLSLCGGGKVGMSQVGGGGGRVSVDLSLCGGS